MIRNGSDFVLTLTKSLFALMIGFLLTVLFGLVMIPILKKIKISQRINVYVEAHARKAGTPTMGGLIFIIPTLVTTIILLLLNKIDFSVNLFILLFVFVSYGMIGFLDDYISIKKNRNKSKVAEFRKMTDLNEFANILKPIYS